MIIPTAHTETDIEDGPLPEMGGKVVLFVRIRDEGVVGSHHSDVEMHEVTEEWGFVGARVASRD